MTNRPGHAEDVIWTQEAAAVAAGIRRRVLALTIERNGCYLSQALSSAEILAALYTRVLHLGPSTAPATPPRFAGLPGRGIVAGAGADYNGPRDGVYDRLLISPAHYAVAIYAALVETGRMHEQGLADFNVDGSTVEMIGAEHSPGFELTTGSFGQALSQAGGIAHARRLRGERGRVAVFMSDGEFEEGQTWEAVQALSFYRLDRVLVYVDVNGQQVDGRTADVMNIEPIVDRLTAFGASVSRIDGHDLEALDAASREGAPGKPHFVLCDTDPARGLPLLDPRRPHLHYVRFRPHELDDAAAALQAMEAS